MNPLRIVEAALRSGSNHMLFGSRETVVVQPRYQEQLWARFLTLVSSFIKEGK